MAFVASASNTYAASDSTVTAVVPAGAASGQLALAFIFVENDSVTASATGWTFEGQVPYYPTHGSLLLLSKHVTGADSGSYTFQLSGSSGGHVAFVGLWSGRDTSDPFTFLTFNDLEADGDAGTAQPGAITGTAAAGDDLVFGFADYAGHDDNVVPGFTEQISEAATGNNLFTADDTTAGSKSAQPDEASSSSYWYLIFAGLKESSGTEPVDAAFAGALALADAAAIVGDFEATAAGQMLGRTAAATADALGGSFSGIEAGQFTGALATATGSSTAGTFSRSISASFAGALATAEAAAIAAALDLTTAVEGPSATAIGRAVAGRFSGNGTVFPLTITGLAGPNLAHRTNGPGRVPDPKTTGPNVNGAATGPGIAYTAHGAGV